jgi:hypothetical protein
MALRTKESLQKMLQASRERQEKKRQQAEIKKVKLREERYQLTLQNQRLDRAKDKLLQQRAKERKMEELQALIKKTPQRALNEATEHPRRYKTYHSNQVERFTPEEDLYTTREELQQYEIEHGGKVGSFINWNAWDKLIAKARQNNKSKS